MLSSMVKEHQTRQQLRREEQERRRKEALQASTSLTNALVDHLNVGVAQAYLNQKRLDGEARRLEQSAAVLQKQTQHWITLVNGFCSALKQVGDVASWTKAIHRDVATVAATLQIAYADTYARTHPGGGQGTSASTLGPLGLPQTSGTRAVTASAAVLSSVDAGTVTASSSVSSSPKSGVTVRAKKSSSSISGAGGSGTVAVVAGGESLDDDYDDDDKDLSSKQSKGDGTVTTTGGEARAGEVKSTSK